MSYICLHVYVYVYVCIYVYKYVYVYIFMHESTTWVEKYSELEAIKVAEKL
jgi:hypothetical protein